MGELTAFFAYSGLARVDDRLVHGQVLVNWVRALALSGLIVVDDNLATDGAARSILRAIVPTGVSLWLCRVKDAAVALAGFSQPIAKCLLLMASPRVALDLYDVGVHYETLNIACLGAAVGRVRLLPQVSLTPAEFDLLDTLASRGVEIVSQAIPSDPTVRWVEIQARASRALLPRDDRL